MDTPTEKLRRDVNRLTEMLDGWAATQREMLKYAAAHNLIESKDVRDSARLLGNVMLHLESARNALAYIDAKASEEIRRDLARGQNHGEPPKASSDR